MPVWPCLVSAWSASGATAVTRLASTLLYGLTPTDPVSLIFAALLMQILLQVSKKWGQVIC